MQIEKHILDNMIDELKDAGAIHEYQFEELILTSTLEEVEEILKRESGLRLMASTHQLECQNTDGKQWINIIHNFDIFPVVNDARDYVQKLLIQLKI